MFLWCSNIYVISGTLGTLYAEFLWSFTPPWISGLGGPYMWSALA